MKTLILAISLLVISTQANAGVKLSFSDEVIKSNTVSEKEIKEDKTIFQDQIDKQKIEKKLFSQNLDFDF